MPPEPPISLRRRRSFRKSVRIHPKSVLGTCSSTAWEVGPFEALPSSFESQELWAGSDRKRVRLWIHLGLLTDRQHADNIFFPNEMELLKIRTVLSMESTEAEKSFSCFRRIHNWLRNTMTTERLSDLAVIAMHAKAVTVGRSVVCEKFVALYSLDGWQRLHFWPTRLVRYFY